jgi:hypothetical protein
MTAPMAVRFGLLGFVGGVVVSVMPFPLHLLLALVLLVLLLVRPFGWTVGGRANGAIAGVVGIVVIVFAILLPVKQLDGRVGPFRYDRLCLDELCRRLGKDHRVTVHSDQATGTVELGSFATDRAMTRREVLEKLAREANCDLHIGYCGTGATFLFGAHPSFTRLLARSAPPDGPAQQKPPMSPATNRTPAAAGSWP